MTNDSAVLSIDFLAGFTIFIIAFVWVISLIPGLLIGLQAHTIDYDAVAYRTGVILVEDPGEIAIIEQNIPVPWESFTNNNSVARFGLAVSKDTPNILSEEKVNQFFCTTVFYPIDYKNKTIFGNYHFNISFHDADRNVDRSIGDVLPEGYGYIRRLVKIKGASNATINAINYKNNDQNVTSHTFSILINTPRLYTDVTDPSYQIDPVKDQIMINITNLTSTKSNLTANVNLTNISVMSGNQYDFYGDDGFIPYPSSITLDFQNSSLPHNVTEDISIKFSPKLFQGLYYGIYDPALYQPIFVNLTFDLDGNSTFLNNTWSSPFDYNYDPANVTQPQLRDAVVEVAIW